MWVGGFICMHTCVCVCMNTCVHVYAYMCVMDLGVYEYMCACVCIHVCNGFGCV